MFLKQERSEMDDFERKRKLGSKVKMFTLKKKKKREKKVCSVYPCYKFTNYFAYSFVSEQFNFFRPLLP